MSFFHCRNAINKRQFYVFGGENSEAVVLSVDKNGFYDRRVALMKYARKRTSIVSGGS